MATSSKNANNRLVKSSKKKSKKDISIVIQEGMSKASNYNKLLFSNIKPYVGKRILEVGCSIGNMTDFFINKEFVYGIEIVDEATKIIKKKYALKKNFNAQTLDIQKLDVKKFKKHRFDTIININVLEHVKDDFSVLKKFNSLLGKKGKVLIIVPAHRWLYGTVDRSDHHFRRYTKKELTYKVKKAGFKIKKLSYFNFIGMFGWFLNGKILRKKTIDEGMLGFYDKMLPFLIYVERFLGFLPGLSLVCVAEKK